MTAQGPKLRALADTLRALGQSRDWQEGQRSIGSLVADNLPTIISALERAAAAEPCICDTGPDTEVPSEDCPQHGRRYSEWVQRGDILQTRLSAAEGEKAEAWAEGRESLAVDMARPASDETGLRPSTPNPYRSAS